MRRPDHRHRSGDDLNSYPRKANAHNLKVLRCRVRQVNNASPYEGTSVIDPNNHMCASVYSCHADHCAERQSAVGRSELFGSVWHLGVERGDADAAFLGRCREAAQCEYESAAIVADGNRVVHVMNIRSRRTDRENVRSMLPFRSKDKLG